MFDLGRLPRVALLSSLLICAIFVTNQVLEASGNAEDMSTTLMLPLVAVSGQPESTILGVVTESGTPREGVVVELRLFNGSSWSTFLQTNTLTDGSYSFSNVPALEAGQKYRVYYVNLVDPSRLAAWRTRELVTFATGDYVRMGTFDVANVELLTPVGGSAVTLPSSFSWELREVESDSYEFNLYDSVTRDPWFYTDPPLGYVDSYTMDLLPAGFNFGQNYVWTIWIYGPHGDQGIAYWANFILFEPGTQNEPVLTVTSARVPGGISASPESLFDR
jgi:hypothetical protein